MRTSEHRTGRWLLVTTGSLMAACLVVLPWAGAAQTRPTAITRGDATYPLYPAALTAKPGIPSPYRAQDGMEVVTVFTERKEYVLVPVTITPGVTICPWEAPLETDREDFPALATTGRHSEAELDRTRTITGRSLAHITELGRPGRLSSSGFLAEDEDILSVLRGDNRLVTRLGLTHAELAKPLLQVCLLLRELYRETGRRHTNDVFYGGHRLTLEVEFSRGGQQSLFNDGLDGAWTITVRRHLEERERTGLSRTYGQLEAARCETVVRRLTEMMAGEMQPFYIYRYGFYEGHTAWRTDPIAIAFMFGLKTLEEIEAVFPGQLHEVLTQHFVVRLKP